MKRVLSSNEILGTIDQPGGEEAEVVASAEAWHDDESGELVVELDSFLRPLDLRHKERHLGAAWLPAPQTGREHVDRDEAADLAKELFHHWARRVRESIPTTGHHH